MAHRLSDDLLRVIIRTFYDEYAIVIIDYILFFKRVEEHHMVQELNLPSNSIRKALLELQEHNILISQEGKRDRRSEEKIGNMFTRGPDQGKMIYWSLDPEYKNVVAYRIIELQNSFENLEKDASRARYGCPKCGAEFDMHEVFPRIKCLNCVDVPLHQKETEIEEARIRKREGLSQMKHLEALMRECFNESHIDVAPRVFSSQIVVTVKPSDVVQQPQAEQIIPINPEIIKYYKVTEKKNPPPVKNGNQVTPDTQLEMNDGEFSVYFNQIYKQYTFL